MFRRLLLLVTALSLIAPPAHAQLVVIDPANLVQTTLIAYRMQQHYAELRAAVPDRASNGAGAGQPGPLSDSDDPHHGARPEPLGLRTAVDSGRSTAAMPPAPRTSRRRCRCSGRRSLPPNADRRGQTDAGAAVRHDRNHRLGGDDGRPPGRSGARIPRPPAERRAVAGERRAQRRSRGTTR